MFTDATSDFATGLMFGPALLGLLADFTSVQTALCANAAVLAAVMGVFALLVSMMDIGRRRFCD